MRRWALSAYLYLLPAGVLFAVFTYVPLVQTFGATFFSQNRRGDVGEFVGLDNYAALLTDDAFLASIGNTVLFAAVSTPLSVLVGLVLAVVARRRTRMSWLYETVFGLTLAVSMSVASMVFQLAFNPTVGLLNELLGTQINWLGDPQYAMGSIIVISVWLTTGFNFIFMLAAVRGMDQEVLEASMLDGAGLVQRTVRITIPLISPTIFFLIVSQLAENLMMSGFVLILAASYGTSSGATDTMISYMYRQATVSFDYNTAYAAAIVAFALSLVAVIAAFCLERRRVHYS